MSVHQHGLSTSVCRNCLMAWSVHPCMPIVHTQPIGIMQTYMVFLPEGRYIKQVFHRWSRAGNGDSTCKCCCVSRISCCMSQYGVANHNWTMQNMHTHIHSRTNNRQTYRIYVTSCAPAVQLIGVQVQVWVQVRINRPAAHLLSHSNHDTCVPWPAHNAGEHSAWGIITSKASLGVTRHRGQVRSMHRHRLRLA